MKRVGVVTATRAEYGLLYPLLKEIDNDSELELCLIVTGTHLSVKYGYTKNEILGDGFAIYKEISILEEGNTEYDVSLTMANAIKEFSTFFRNEIIDLLVLIGDRTEMLGIASAALNARIPIAHISGGSVTEGAVDDCVRHCLTKMSYLHFTTTEVYRNRVIQMGEEPERVVNAGSLAVDNIVRLPLMSETKIRNDIGISEGVRYAVVTFHPVTREQDSGVAQVTELIEAMRYNSDIFFVITGPNADSGSMHVNKMMNQFCNDSDHAVFIESLGRIRYLSAVQYASFVMGNSSSGLTEAPALGTSTINIGDRQNGRIMVDTVINVEPNRQAIIEAINTAITKPKIRTEVYGNGMAAKIIVEKIKKELVKGINLKKRFYDISSLE